MPHYTRCLGPHSTDPKLCANREKDYYHIKEVLRNLILAKGEEERRLLIHGDRGVGKSILLKKVLSHLKQELDFILVIVDGRNSKNEEDLLRDVCEKLAAKLRDVYKKDDKAISEISYLDEISRVDTISKGWARSTVTEIEAKTGGEIGFLSFFKASLGVGSREAEEEELTETIKIEINSRFLRQLLSHVITTITPKKEVIIAVDNLDQIHDKNQIAEFVREIFKHRESPIIATLRSEAITLEFRRCFRDPIIIKGSIEAELDAILAKRIEDCPEKEHLEEKLTPIANSLKKITDNPLSFLTWLHYLCNNSELNPGNLKEDLDGFILTFYGLEPNSVTPIGEFFLKDKNPFLTKTEILDKSHISKEDYEKMIENGILVPDDLYEPRKYHLSSDLTFLQLNL